MPRHIAPGWMSTVRPGPMRPPDSSSTVPSNRTALLENAQMGEPDETGALVVLRHSIKNAGPPSAPRDMNIGVTVGIACGFRPVCVIIPGRRRRMVAIFMRLHSQGCRDTAASPFRTRAQRVSSIRQSADLVAIRPGEDPLSANR